MVARITMIAVIVVAGTFIAFSQLKADANSSKLLSVKLVEETKNRKVLADYAILAKPSGDIGFVSGGEMRTKDSDVITFGTQFSGSIKNGKDGSLRLLMTLKLGNPVSSDDPITQIVRSEMLELRTDLISGVKKRIYCGGDRWCELLVENP